MRRTLAVGLVVAVGVLIGAARAEAAAAASPNAQTRAILNRTMPAINLTNVTLKDAIDFIRDVSGANVHVNWNALEEAGITGDTQVNVKLQRVSLRKVLTLLLSEAGPGGTLTFYLDDGVIEVTTRAIADNQMFTIVYPVQDLLFEPPQFIEPPDFGLANESNAGGRGGRGGGGRSGGGSGFGTGGSGYGSGQAQQPKEKDAKANELVQLIREVVQPDVWAENGGKASIRHFNGNLIVTAPRSVHEAIGGPID